MLDRILIGSSAEPSDTNFKNVTLLLHGDGSNGAQNNTFIDSSTNNFTITRNGNTTQGSFSPYGSNWSNYFDGSGDYLSAPYSVTNSEWWTQDFTIEMWVYNNTNAVSSTTSLALQLSHGIATAVDTYWSFGTNASGQLDFYYFNGSANRVTSSASASLNTWNHIAMVYTHSSGNISLYLNGSRVATATKSGTPQNSSGSAINVGVSQNTFYNGYISNLRIIDGTALYSGTTYTVPTAPLTAITNTSLLTCAYNRFRDGSTNNFTITRNGDVKVTNFAPFAPSSAYSTTTNGGSSYYDGDTDYLSVPNSTEFVLNGTFTLEAWVYPTGDYSKFQCIITKRAGNTPAAWQLYIEINTGYLGYYNGSGYVSTSQVPLNQWSHVAGVYDGTNINLYLNGVRVLQSATTNTDQSTDVKIGYHFSSVAEPFKGYLTDVRVVKGGQVYSGTTYTVPTAPLTAISGTSLLVRATNAAIFDNSMKNDLETVGNAQISTSVKKFGTGSMYFDGNGDYLVGPNNQALNFRTGDFTIEWWMYCQIDWSSMPNTPGVIGQKAGDGAAGWQIYRNTEIDPTRVMLRIGNTGTVDFSSSATPTTQQWEHWAVTRQSGTLRWFRNGTLTATHTSVTTDINDTSGGLWIGRSQTWGGYFTGYIDDIRVTTGLARYTANFTPPTAPFPNK